MPRLWPLVTILLALPLKALACGTQELAAFIAAAQSLAPGAESAGLPLLSCPGESAEAGQWLAFYGKVSGLSAKAPGVRIIAPPATPKGELGTAIRAAYNNQVTELRDKIDHGDPRFVQSAAAHLALGRALMRLNRFSEGRSAYASYLRLVDHAYREEAEYLYSFIWAGELDQAAREFSSISLTSIPRDHAAAIQRGQALIAKLSPEGSPPTPRQGGQPRKPAYSASSSILLQRQALERISGGLEYHGPLSLRWRHHVTKVLIYDRSLANADEFWVGSAKDRGGAFYYRAYAGLFARKRSAWLVDGALGTQAFGGLYAETGINYSPLILTTPLVESRLDLLQSRVYAALGWRDLLHWRSSYLKDGAQGAAFERHELSTQIPLAAKAGDARISFLGGAAIEARPRPSPDYDSYRRSYHFNLGLGAYAQDTDTWTASGEVRYLMLQSTTFYAEPTRVVRSGLEAKAGMITHLKDSLRLEAGVGFKVLESGWSGHPLEQTLSLNLAASLVQ